MQVATTWILGAVTRNDLAGTFALTDPDIRGSMSREEWESGDIPVVPYPVGELSTRATGGEASRVADRSTARDAARFPRRSRSTVAAVTFILGLKRVGTGSTRRWVVNYWSPKYRAEVPLRRA